MLSFLSNQNLFNQSSNKDAIKNTLAVLLINIVNADNKISDKEQNKVIEFYNREFNMSREATITLFDSVKHDEGEFYSATNEIKDILQHDTIAKAKILQHLNEIIICDGCVDEEYSMFETIRSILL